MSGTPDPWETADAAFQSSEAYLSGDYDQRTGQLRSESRCDRCGGANPVWHAPHDLWNAAVRTDGADEWPFLCPSCFATVAEERGVVSDRTVWALVPDDDLRSAGAERDALREALEDACKIIVSEHGHDSVGSGRAPWPSCLPVHMVLNRARDLLADLSGRGGGG